MKESIRRISFLCSLLLLSLPKSYAQSEMNLLDQVRNRITINHENGEKEVFTVTEKSANPKTQRLYHWYQAQRVQQTQGGYAGKLLDGAYSHYSSNKQLIQQGTYKRGLAHGQWKEWRTNNRLAKVEYWRRGEREGGARHYDEKGQLSLQGKMKDGQWNGKVWTFNRADSSYRWDYYAKGVPISQSEYIQSNIFRRTGQFLTNIWGSIFHMQPNPEKPLTE